MATNWGKEETSKLIALWGQEEVQSQLEGCRSNRQVYEKIAIDMNASNFARNFIQCREKIKKLKAEYRAIINKKHKKTGESRTDWEYFEPLDAILGHKPATHPPIVIDTLGDELGLETQSETEEVSAACEDGGEDVPVSPRGAGNSSATGSLDTSANSAASSESTPGPSGLQSEEKPGRKRKKTKAEKIA